MGAFYLAGCVITDNNGKILLIHRNKPNHVQWEMPGGKIEEGEDPVLTAEREAKEELGVEVDVTDKLCDYYFTEHLAAGTFTNHFTWYRAVIKSGEPKAMEQTYDDVGYFSIQQLESGDIPISAATRDFLKELKAGNVVLA